MLPPSFTSDFLSQLEMLKLRARRAFLGRKQGGHISLKRGHGLEFSDYRKYELGDDPRHIDWSVYARNERLYVKVFQEEQDLSVMLLLDATASMATPESDRKWEMMRNITIALAYVALMQQDRVTISIPGYMHSPFYSGGAAIHRIADLLQQTRVVDVSEFDRGVQQAVSRLRFPGIAVFISDFLMPLEDIERSFNILRSKNLDVTAIQVLGPNDVSPLENMEHVIAIDSESGEEIQLTLNEEVRDDYGFLLMEHNQKLKEFLFGAGISYALGLSNQDIADFVVDDLSGAVLLQ